jgi:hypothetical protein
MTSDYRKLLQELETEQQRTYDTTVITLSGGALGVSFAFVKDFVSPDTMIQHGILVVAWICWAFSIITILASHLISVEMLRAAIRAEDQKNPQGRIRWVDGFMLGLNVSGGVLFVAGVIFLAVFIGNNLGKGHDQANGATSAPAASARPDA